MNKFDKETIKSYLLGKISDEEKLGAIEESLFLNEEFASEVELVEDEIINDFVLGNLSAEDAASAENCFFKTSERQFKLKLTQELKARADDVKQTEKSSFFDALKSFFRQPAMAGAFAILLVAAIGFSVYFWRSKESPELAELQTIYAKERRVEPRISEFNYAPFGTTRGADENQENINKIRRIENAFLDAVAQNDSAENHRNLGVFYLTRKNFPAAIRELEKAAALDDKSAKILNDLGSAYFESARNESKEKQFQILPKAFEKFSRAVELNPNLLEALFNKALCQQELGQSNEAKDTWRKYLEKDSTSGWAKEAKEHLQRLENLQTGIKTKEEVLADFLEAFRAENFELAWKINCQTKEMIKGVWLPDQLSRRVLEARIDNDDDKTRKAIEALKFIGNLEKEKADFFVADLAEYYSKIDRAQAEILLKAKDSMRAGYETVEKLDYDKAILIFGEARRLFAQTGNELEEKNADFWLAQCESGNRKIAESEKLLSSVSDFCRRKNYRWLDGQILSWRSDNAFLQNEFSKNIEQCKEVLKISQELSDTYTTQKSLGCLANTYIKLGELEQSEIYLSKNFAIGDLYYESRNQISRNYLHLSRFFDRREMPATAAGFIKERLYNALEGESQFKLSRLDELAKIYGHKKDFTEALRFADEAKNFAQNLFAQNLKESTFKQSRIANATFRIAELKREKKDCASALSDYESALEIYSQMSEAKINLYETHKGKLLCFQALNRTEELQSELELILNLSEKSRENILNDDERQTFFDNEQIIYDAAIENSLAKGDAARAFELAESSKARALLDFVVGKNSVADIEKQFSEVSKPLSLAEIQTRMPENVQILQFAVLHEKTVVWTLTRGEFKDFEIEIPAEDLEKKVSGFLQLVNGKAAKTEIETAGKELYALLVKPILSDLDSSKEICIIADKALHPLPFAALISADGRFLLEDFKIFNAPSASVFVAATEKSRELEKITSERLLSVGNPAFDKEENAGLDALPSAEEEARTIARMYPNAKQFVGADATKNSFLNEMQSAEIIHFAGHYVAATSPQYSKLLFSGGDLRSFELASARLPNSKLVVLSACQTGIEKLYRGEGAIGIARTFLAIGAPVVVASRWKVDSAATKDLMIAFHRNRREKNLSSVEALRAAQIEMLRGADENFRQPYFWSAFSVIGASANY
jgi:CHAT domain-containing protein/Tfp pilus assembly protein PilF